jgi:hypothetical protein
MSKRSSRGQTTAVASPLDTSDGEGGRSKRRRVKTTRFDFQFLENEEQRLLQQVQFPLLMYFL